MDYRDPTAASQHADLFPHQPLIYGSFGERLGAIIIDSLILIIPNFILQYALGRPGGSALSLIVSWLYFAVQESGPNQATIGKKALGLKVVNTEGQQISFGQATGRYFSKIISGLILLIGYLMMLWDERKQTLHDKIAGTFVIKR